MRAALGDAQQPSCETRQPPGKYRLSRLAALLAVLLVAGTANGAGNSQLIALINDYRQSPQRCEDRAAQPVGPLAPEDALAAVQISTGTSLQTALRQVGYQAASAQVIGVAGPANAQAAMNAIKQRYCSVLLSQQYADIGIAREGNSWQILLARPLLSKDLGDWQTAGKQVLKLINQARAQPRSCGKEEFEAASPLAWDDQLAETALAHSRDMASHDYFSHSARDGSQVDTRATRAGYSWRGIGENLAAGQGTAEQAVSGWLASPGHCANIMNPNFTETGVAYAVNRQSDAVIYWTQVFGTPH